MNAHQTAAFPYPLCHKFILYAGLWHPAGMVVHKDNMDGLIGKCLLKNLSWRDDGGVDRPDRDDFLPQQYTLGIKHAKQKLFPVLMT